MSTFSCAYPVFTSFFSCSIFSNSGTTWRIYTELYAFSEAIRTYFKTLVTVRSWKSDISSCKEGCGGGDAAAFAGAPF